MEQVIVLVVRDGILAAVGEGLRRVSAGQQPRIASVLAAIALREERGASRDEGFEIGRFEAALRSTGAWDATTKDFEKSARRVRDALVDHKLATKVADGGTTKVRVFVGSDVRIEFGRSAEERAQIRALLAPLIAALPAATVTTSAAPPTRGSLAEIVGAELFPSRDPSVVVRIGDILTHRGADLTLMPCSAKGTISDNAESKRAKLGFPSPSPQPLGEVHLVDVEGPAREFTRRVAWCASVLNKTTTIEAIESIGARVAEHANTHAGVRLIESPLLGAGAGRLDPIVAGLALRRGFLRAAAVSATLVIFFALPRSNTPARTSDSTCRRRRLRSGIWAHQDRSYLQVSCWENRRQLKVRSRFAKIFVRARSFGTVAQHLAMAARTSMLSRHHLSEIQTCAREALLRT